MNQQLSGPRHWLHRAAMAVGAVATVAVSLVLSIVLFSVLLVAGVVAFGVMWWKTRDLRAAMRDAQAQMRQRAAQHQAQRGQTRGGDVLEGEYSVVDEQQDREA